MAGSIPLAVLAAFVLWTALLLLALAVARARHLATGGSSADFARPDSALLVYRLYRAHINCAENLPLFTAAVLIIVVRGVSGTYIDALALTYIVFRVAQSTIHVLNINPTIRFACFLLQMICLVGLVVAGINR